MSAVIADTHTVIWSFDDPSRLSQSALRALKSAETWASPVYVSAISLVEICYLVERGRVVATAFDHVLQLLDASDHPLALAAVERGVAEALRQIPRPAIPEMPDRIIAATAVHLGLPLITRNRMIRAAGIQTIW